MHREACKELHQLRVTHAVRFQAGDGGDAGTEQVNLGLPVPAVSDKLTKMTA